MRGARVEASRPEKLAARLSLVIASEVHYRRVGLDARRDGAIKSEGRRPAVVFADAASAAVGGVARVVQQQRFECKQKRRRYRRIKVDYVDSEHKIAACRCVPGARLDVA